MVTEITSDNFDKEVEKSKTPVIADFFADWCGPCQMLKPVFEKVSKDYEKKLKFVKVNTENNQELAQKYDVSGIPCLIIINKGKEVDRIVGFMPEVPLKKEIDKILSKI